MRVGWLKEDLGGFLKQAQVLGHHGPVTLQTHDPSLQHLPAPTFGH